MSNDDFVNASDKNKKNKPQKYIVASGRIENRNENYAKAMTYYLHKSIDDMIRNTEFASGNKQLIVNYLLQRGIEAVLEDREMIIVDTFEGINKG